MNYLLILLSTVFIFAGCKREEKTVVIAGDSWGFFLCQFKSLNAALRSAAVDKAEVHPTCDATTQPGMHASGWLTSNFHKATLNTLRDPTVKVMLLSLGGNDLMAEWNKNMTPEVEEVLFRNIRDHVALIVEEYRKIRPDIRILVSGYDFPRFTSDHPFSHYREVFERMGSPTPLEINKSLARFSSVMAELADSEKVFYIQHLGLMHYYFGNPSMGLNPGLTLSPDQISPPEKPDQIGGDLNFQTDVLGMLYSTTLGYVDAFHLSAQGYEKLGDQVVSHYLKSWMSDAP